MATDRDLRNNSNEPQDDQDMGEKVPPDRNPNKPQDTGEKVPPDSSLKKSMRNIPRKDYSEEMDEKGRFYNILNSNP